MKLDADRTVTATFGVPKGTAITKAKVNRRKRKATFSFSAPGAITGFQCKLVKPKPKAKKHRKKGRGHKRAKPGKKRRPPRFSACSGPKTYKSLRPGRYRFEVRGLDILGADARPALKKFTVRKPKKKKKSRRR